VTCRHERIVTWTLEDGETAGLWSCAHCHRKFEPVAKESAQRAPSEGPTEHDGAGATRQGEQKAAKAGETKGETELLLNPDVHQGIGPSTVERGASNTAGADAPPTSLWTLAAAERYRWLREHTVATGISRWMGKHQFLDSAIDEAMTGGK
jgi:hypothetical protein